MKPARKGETIFRTADALRKAFRRGGFPPGMRRVCHRVSSDAGDATPVFLREKAAKRFFRAGASPRLRARGSSGKYIFLRLLASSGYPGGCAGTASGTEVPARTTRLSEGPAFARFRERTDGARRKAVSGGMTRIDGQAVPAFSARCFSGSGTAFTFLELVQFETLWNNFSLKRCAFQTIRPVVSRKKRGFFRSLRAGRRCAAASHFAFEKGEAL